MSTYKLNLSLKFYVFNAWEDNLIICSFQVQNVIFSHCPTMHALEFSTKGFGYFSFYVYVCVSRKLKTCAS